MVRRRAERPPVAVREVDERAGGVSGGRRGAMPRGGDEGRAALNLSSVADEAAQSI